VVAHLPSFPTSVPPNTTIIFSVGIVRGNKGTLGRSVGERGSLASAERERSKVLTTIGCYESLLDWPIEFFMPSADSFVSTASSLSARDTKRNRDRLKAVLCHVSDWKRITDLQWAYTL
jgi:hypothetical protein